MSGRKWIVQRPIKRAGTSRPAVSEARADQHGMHGRVAARDESLRDALEGYERIGAQGHARRVRDRLAGAVGATVE
jgi:hypothetical protein